MSFVIAAPESVTEAARSLSSLGSAINAAHSAASAPTTGVLAAASDEVSVAIAAVFSRHASAYQGLSAQAATFHTQLVQTLRAGAVAYETAEAANAGPLRTLQHEALQVINTPTDTLLGRPLIGPGFNGGTTPQGIGTPGGGGGILWGKGGHGGASTAPGVPGGVGGPAGLLGTGGTGGMGGSGAGGGRGGTGGLLSGHGGTGGLGGPTGIGGAGGDAVMLGTGGTGGQGGTFTDSASGGRGGLGGTGGLLWGNGGKGGIGGPFGIGGPGGNAQWFGHGGTGGIGGAFANGGLGGRGGFLVGDGGNGGTGGVVTGAGGAGGLGGHLWGHPGATGAHGGPATVKLIMNGTRPELEVSVNDGPQSMAFIDTGSTTTLIPIQNVNVASLGPPTGSGVYDFGPAGTPTLQTKTYYTTYTASLNLGDGIATKPMTIGVITNETNGVGTPIPQNDWEGVLGVGSNTNSATYPVGFVQQLPGNLNQGVLVNQPGKYFEFGPNPLTPFASVHGAPETGDLQTLISYNGVSTGLQPISIANIDTGGVGGDIPQNLLPAPLNTLAPGTALPPGTTVTVEAPSLAGPYQTLYQQTVGSIPGYPDMRVTSPETANPPGVFNTGNYIFSQMPIYFSYSVPGGTTYFDSMS